MRYQNVIALNAINAATAGAQNSSQIDSRLLFSMSVQVVAAGAPVGVVKVQVSNDEGSSIPIPFSPTNWVDLPSISVAISASGNFLIPKFDLCYNYVRIVYTKTSGTGSITAEVKSLGA